MTRLSEHGSGDVLPAGGNLPQDGIRISDSTLENNRVAQIQDCGPLDVTGDEDRTFDGAFVGNKGSDAKDALLVAGIVVRHGAER